MEQAKIEASKKIVIALERKDERMESMLEVAANLIKLNSDNAFIHKATDLEISVIEKLRAELK